jgi:hypothetical protein
VIRAMKAGIQQGGIAGAADLATQWNLIEAGEQRDINGWRTLGVAAAGGLNGVVGSKIGGAKSEHVGITSEGPPKQQVPSPDVKVVEPASVASRSDSQAQGLAPQETPAILQVQDQAELRAVEPTTQPTPLPDRASVDSRAVNAGSEEVQLGISSRSGPPGDEPPRIDGPAALDTLYKTLWTKDDAAAPLAQRVVRIIELAANNPVSEKYVRAEVGEVGRKNYPDGFFAVHGEELRRTVEVHRAVEDGIHGWYPGLFTAGQINSFANLRGIRMDGIGTALHRSVIRREWDVFYLKNKIENKRPTQEEVLSYATAIDKKYGGLFIPPL